MIITKTLLLTIISMLIMNSTALTVDQKSIFKAQIDSLIAKEQSLVIEKPTTGIEIKKEEPKVESESKYPGVPESNITGLSVVPITPIPIKIDPTLL